MYLKSAKYILSSLMHRPVDQNNSYSKAFLKRNDFSFTEETIDFSSRWILSIWWVISRTSLLMHRR